MSESRHRRTASTSSNLQSIDEEGASVSLLSSHQNSDKKTFTIKDVKSEFETEAEATILKVIEENEKIARITETDEQGIRRPSFLADIPSEKVHLFVDNVEDIGSVEKEKEVGIGSEDVENPHQKLKSATNRLMMLKRLTSTVDLTKEKNDLTSIEEANEFFRMQNEIENNVKNEDKPASIEKLSYDDNAINYSYDGNVKKMEHSHRNEFYHRYCWPCIKLVNILAQSTWKYIGGLSILTLMLVGVAAILFYFCDNPLDSNGVAYSWILLLVAKLVATSFLAVVVEAIIVDFLFLETRLAVMTIGRFFTLMTVQAKGWPLRIVFWSFWNYALIIGDIPWKQHWLGWQETIELFTPKNPGPNQEQLEVLNIIMVTCIILGLSTMVKRAYFAFLLGKKKYEMFSPQLKREMWRVLVITQVALLAEELEKDSKLRQRKSGAYKRSNVDRSWLFSDVKSSDIIEVDDDEDDENDEDEIIQYDRKYSFEDDELEASNKPINMKRKKFTWDGMRRKIKKITWDVREESGDFDNIGLEKLLGEWDEPIISSDNVWRTTSVSHILEFREGVDYLGSEKPFSIAFGLADTRKHCMESAINVYKSLLLDDRNTSRSVLHFDTLSILARDENGGTDKNKSRRLIKMFRPDVEGNITLLNFLKACDKVYRRLRLFRASVVNSNHLDDALEMILNCVFYVLMICLILVIYSIDPTKIFLATTSLSVSLSFAIGNASSKWFEGVLFVIVRKPYDIGDRIAISDPKVDTSSDGSTTWFVEAVTLFSTTVRNAATNEVATYNNGYLAGTRIINAARSPKAIVCINLKFGIDVSYEKVKIFQTVVENFVKDHPQEWLKLLAFRATTVEADLGYIGYVLVLQHVEAWQNIGPIKESQANLSSFCLEVCKQMDMRFISPPKPIHISFANEGFENQSLELGESRTGVQSLMKMFRQRSESS